MSWQKKLGFCVIVLLYLALATVMLTIAGITLYNILWAIVAGGIIFVPIYKRWFSHDA